MIVRKIEEAGFSRFVLLGEDAIRFFDGIKQITIRHMPTENLFQVAVRANGQSESNSVMLSLENFFAETAKA